MYQPVVGNVGGGGDSSTCVYDNVSIRCYHRLQQLFHVHVHERIRVCANRNTSLLLLVLLLCILQLNSRMFRPRKKPIH